MKIIKIRRGFSTAFDRFFIDNLFNRSCQSKKYVNLSDATEKTTFYRLLEKAFKRKMPHIDKVFIVKIGIGSHGSKPALSYRSLKGDKVHYIIYM